MEDGQKYIQCKNCYDYIPVNDDTIAATCSHCVVIKCLKEMPIEDFYSSGYQKKSTGRPAGWHFMKEFVDKDGNVFHKGKEQTELKGTLKPTKIVPRKKKKKLSADEKLFRKAARHKARLKANRRKKN